MKKFFFIVIVIFIALIFGAGYYFIMMNTDDETETEKNNGGFDLNFGTPTNDTNVDFGVPNSDTQDGTTETIPTLRKISGRPVAGYSLFGLGASTTARFAEKLQGYINDSLVSSLEINRVASANIPKIREVYFLSPNDLVMRYLREDGNKIESYLAKLTPKEGLADEPQTFSFDGKFLDPDITNISVNEKQSQLAFVHGQNGAKVYIESPTKAKRQIYSSPLKEWLVDWPQADSVVITSKPSGYVLGYSYVINPTKGSASVLVRGYAGLTTLLSPNKKMVIFSSSENNSVSLYIKNTETESVGNTDIQTLPEKCTWSENSTTIVYCAVPRSVPKATYPDAWYMGEVQFNDDIWRIDTSTRQYRLLEALEENSREKIDAISLKLSTDESYLFFINKVDASLWSLKL